MGCCCCQATKSNDPGKHKQRSKEQKIQNQGRTNHEKKKEKPNINCRSPSAASAKGQNLGWNSAAFLCVAALRRASINHPFPKATLWKMLAWYPQTKSVHAFVNLLSMHHVRQMLLRNSLPMSRSTITTRRHRKQENAEQTHQEKTHVVWVFSREFGWRWKSSNSVVKN